MTTQTPYGPTPPGTDPQPGYLLAGAYRSAGVDPAAAHYPTAPPWAPAEEPPQPAAAPWAGAPYTEHGRLMVPFPNEMINAAREAPPSWWPVVLTTFVLNVLSSTAVFFALFGVLPIWCLLFGALPLLGIVATARRASAAHRQRNARYPFWLAYLATLMVGGVLWSMTTVFAAPLYLADVVEPGATKAVQSSMTGDGKIATPAGITVQDVTCTPTAARATDGLRAYSCVVTLSDGQSGTMKVVGTVDGDWAARK
ncbi:hypothetical protein ACWKSP_07000 [Micromonosporaceae bacterium Da 78-11]